MAPLTDAAKESMWFRSLGAAAAVMKGKVQKGQDGEGCVHPEKVGNVPEELRQWCSFEFAELLEEGMGPGLTSDLTAVPRDKYKEEHLIVQRSQNRQEFQLTTEDGSPLVVARVNADGTQYDMFAANDSQPPRVLGPAFTLKSNAAKNEWCLHSVRCEQCWSRGKRQCGSREVARMTHYCETVGDGQAFCLDLELPAIDADGASAVFCPVCNDSGEEGVVELTTRRPKWNPKHKSLTLDFAGRVSMASAKNFQLEDPNKPGKVKFLYGKVGENQFVLDYRYPLGPVQAFAAALSASHWQ